VKVSYWVSLAALITCLSFSQGYEKASCGANADDYRASAPFQRTNGISQEADKRIGPFYPSEVTAEVLSRLRVRVSWLGTGDDRVINYMIYRAGSNSVFEKVGQVSATGNNRGQYIFEEEVPASGLYRYVVTAVNNFGRESQRSSEAVVTVP
jgi:hypothetical protein